LKAEAARVAGGTTGIGASVVLSALSAGSIDVQP
jgi:hypothetical protein